MTEPQSAALQEPTNQSIGEIKLSGAWREWWFAYSSQGFIPSKNQLCFSFSFFFPTQLSSLRNEVCCAGILLPVYSPSCSSAPYANLWKQSTFLLPLTLGGSSFHHITAIQPINHPLFLHEKEPSSSSWSQQTPNPPSRHSSASHWADRQPKLTFPRSKQRTFWGILKEFPWKSKESSAGTAPADVDCDRRGTDSGVFRGDPWEREARSPNPLSDRLT